MPDSQEPKYSKPWCWSCEAHKRYIYVETTGSDHGTKGRKSICRSCGARMQTPLLMDLGGFKLGCSLMYFVPVICFLAFMGWKVWNMNTLTSSTDLFLRIAISGALLILPPAYLLHRMARKYAVWKKWAKERGWEEKT